jgi:hypothetical protein
VDVGLSTGLTKTIARIEMEDTDPFAQFAIAIKGQQIKPGLLRCF